MSFDGLVMTRHGKAELIKATDEGSLNFTHIAFGDGVTNDLPNLKDELSHEIARLEIAEVERKDDRIILSLDYTNRSFAKGFYFRELGVIGNGELCYYDNAGSDAEYIDPDNDSVTKEKRLRIELIISDVVNVETGVRSDLYALKEDVERDKLELRELLEEKIEKEHDYATLLEAKIIQNGCGDVAGGKNLFNVTDLEQYMNLSADSGEYVAVTDAYIYGNKKYLPYDISFINFLCKNDYLQYTQRFYRIACYDKNKQFINRLSGIPEAVKTKITLPSGTKYIRIGVNFDSYDQTESMAFTDSESFEPYFESNKMLAEENAQQEAEMMDIKMLGWSVPRECPVQNEMNSNQFILKVGRVDLGSLDWTYQTENTRFITSIPSDMKQTTGTRVANIMYLYGYKTISDGSDIGSIPDKSIYISNNMLVIHNSAYTDASAFKSAMQGQYLYYDLATPITTTIDGNEIGETVGDVRKETTVNLLDYSKAKQKRAYNWAQDNILNVPDVDHFTINKETGELSGTADTYAYILFPIKLKKDKNAYMHIANNTTVGLYNLSGTEVTDTKTVLFQGKVITDFEGYFALRVNEGDTISGFAMISTSPITEYVPYTGDTGSLNGDVADLRDDVDGMDKRVSTQKINIHYGKGRGNDIAPVKGTSYIKTPPILVDGMSGIFEDVEESGGGGVKQFDYTYALKGSIKFTVLDTLISANTTASGIAVKPSTSGLQNGHYYRITGTATEDVTIPLYSVKNPSSDQLYFVTNINKKMSESTFYYLISDASGNTKQFGTEEEKQDTTTFSGHSGEVKVSLVVKSGVKISFNANVRAGYSGAYSINDRSDKKYSDTEDNVLKSVLDLNKRLNQIGQVVFDKGISFTSDGAISQVIPHSFGSTGEGLYYVNVDGESITSGALILATYAGGNTIPNVAFTKNDFFKIEVRSYSSRPYLFLSIPSAVTATAKVTIKKLF